MWVNKKAASGAETMTLAASSFTLKARMIDKMSEHPISATEEDKSSFSVNSTSLQKVYKINTQMIASTKLS